VFVNDGEVSSTRYVIMGQNGLSLKAEGGEVMFRSLAIHPLNSAWPQAVEHNP